MLNTNAPSGKNVPKGYLWYKSQGQHHKVIDLRVTCKGDNKKCTYEI